MSAFDGSDFLKLAELLKPQKDSDNSDEEDDGTRPPKVKDLGPQDFNPKALPDQKDGEKSNKDKRNDEILDPEEEVLRFLESDNIDTADWRKTPQWDITYRQQVTPNDVFLGMGGKTPATSSCENMVITVHLPGEKRQNVNLKITCERLQLVSPRFRLDIPLPHPVDPQRGNAEFNSEAEKLVVSLVLNREFDYINF